MKQGKSQTCSSTRSYLMSPQIAFFWQYCGSKYKHRLFKLERCSKKLRRSCKTLGIYFEGIEKLGVLFCYLIPIITPKIKILNHWVTAAVSFVYYIT